MKKWIFASVLAFAILPLSLPAHAAKAVKGSKRAPAAKSEDDSGGKSSGGHRFYYDLGIGGGKVGSTNYTELNLGLTYTFWRPILGWRNSFFYRWNSNIDNYYGLDSSIRATLDFDMTVAGLTLYGGPGVRIPSKGKVAPIAEAGAIANLVGFSLGVGIKTIFNSVVTSGAPDDQQIILILTGGGSF